LVGCASAAANSAEKSNLPGSRGALVSGTHHPATGHPGGARHRATGMKAPRNFDFAIQSIQFCRGWKRSRLRKTIRSSAGADSKRANAVCEAATVARTSDLVTLSEGSESAAWDHYEDALKELLKKKVSGEKVEAPRAREPAKVISLWMRFAEAWTQSVVAVRAGKANDVQHSVAIRRKPVGHLRGRRRLADFTPSEPIVFQILCAGCQHGLKCRQI